MENYLQYSLKHSCILSYFMHQGKLSHQTEFDLGRKELRMIQEVKEMSDFL